MLTNHRRAIGWSAVLFGAMIFVFVAVGRHPPELAPKTTLPFVGEFDLSVYHWMDDIRNGVLTLLARVLNVLGGGIVTIPLRVAVAVWLAFRKRWRAFATWVITWAAAELILTAAKTFFHRGRPPLPLVDVVGFSFPSGHAVAGAATAVALVLVLLPAGPGAAAVGVRRDRVRVRDGAVEGVPERALVLGRRRRCPVGCRGGARVGGPGHRGPRRSRCAGRRGRPRRPPT